MYMCIVLQVLVAGENPQPPALNDHPDCNFSCQNFSYSPQRQGTQYWQLEILKWDLNNS